MKIAIATFADLPSPPVKGGAVETLIDIICQINEKKKKIDIDLFSIADKNAEIKAAEYHQTEFVYYQKYYSKKINVKSIAWKLFKKSIPDKTMSGITSLINKEDYDFVIITSINNEMEYIFRKIHSKVIWYLHGDPLSVLSTDAIERITNQCYSVITVSDFVKSRVKSAAPGCRAVTVRNCTDLIPIPDKEVTVVKQKIRNKAEIGMKDKLFVYIGRIIPIKGVYELVRAFVSADMQNAKLLIVGAPSNRGEEIYLEKIKEIANSNVKYWGYADHDKLNELYCAADCVVAPSICQEAAPLIALELYSTYLSYLPKDKVCFPLKMNDDNRGSFTELLKSEKVGQISVNISKPGITKGEHWHNTKWEFFIVVSGHGLIQERKIGTDEVIEFEVFGDKIEAVHMLPGYTHNIINLSDTENLVTVMWANEQFDPKHPDTFYEKVEKE